MRVVILLAACLVAVASAAYRGPPRGPPGPYGPPPPGAYGSPHSYGPYSPAHIPRKPPRPEPYRGKVRRQPPSYHHPNYFHHSSPAYPFVSHNPHAGPGVNNPVPAVQGHQQLPQVPLSAQLPPQNHVPHNPQVAPQNPVPAQLPQTYPQQLPQHSGQLPQPYSFPLHYAQQQSQQTPQYSPQIPLGFPQEYEGFGQAVAGSSPVIAQVPHFPSGVDNGPIHTVPAPKLSLADRPASFANHVPSYIKEHHSHEDPSSYKAHIPSYFAPDPDPHVPTLTVPPTKDPQSLPSNGQVPLDLYLQQQAEAAATANEQNVGSEQGETLSEQDLFKLLNYQPELATNTIPQLYSPLYIPQTYSFQGYDSHHAASEQVSDTQSKAEESSNGEEENTDEIMKSAEASAAPLVTPTRPARALPEVNDDSQPHDRSKRY